MTKHIGLFDIDDDAG